MAVCNFFLAGRCKYGDRCYNEHPRDGRGGGGGGGVRGVTFRDSFGAANQQNQNPFQQTQSPFHWSANQQQNQQAQPQQGGGNTVQDIVRSLPKEMDIWQTSGMWPFSCFSLDKDITSLPDFVDMSPEELRLDAYNAIKDGSVASFKQNLSMLSEAYRTKQEQIKCMSPQMQQTLIQFLEQGRIQKAAKGSSQSWVKPSTFGGFGSNSGENSGGTHAGGAPSSSSLFATSAFGAAAAQGTQGFAGSAGASFAGSQTVGISSSVFGQSQPQTGLFGQSGAAQAGTAGGAVFGQTGLFGAAGSSGSNGPALGLFGQTGAPATSIPPAGLFAQLGSQATKNLPTGLFHQQTTTASTNPPPPGLFGKHEATGSVFGQAASTGNGNVFGTGVFGSAAPGTSATNPPPGLFGKPASADVLGGGQVLGSSPSSALPPTSSTVFGQPSESAATGLFGKPAPTQSVFGGAMASGTGVFGAGVTGGGGQSDASVYTPLADLTAEEKLQFEAKMFTLGKIPMRPPPFELINI